jgi:phospholipase C
MRFHTRFQTLSFTTTIAIGVLATGSWISGCSGHDRVNEAGNATSGSVKLVLTGGGAIFTSFSYTVTGPLGFSTTGSLDVSKSSTLSGVIGGLPAGNGFKITLTGTSVDGLTQCAGSATFSVVAHGITPVTLTLDCHQPAKTGSISVAGTFNICPTIQSISANPGEVLGGSSSSITSMAVDPDNGPSPLSYHWTATSGSFSDATSPNPSYTCTTSGLVTLTLMVSDGDPQASCADTGTVQVTCSGHVDTAAEFATATKIKHLVVVFGENISFDHYFASYPHAQNNPGEAPFVGAAGTPAVNGLSAPLDVMSSFAPLAGVDLLNNNPTASNSANGTGAVNPFRLGPGQAATTDQGHNYKPEQQASNNGAMDLFPEFTGTAGPPPGTPPSATTKGIVMGYYDGNTVSELWSLAQNYALNDNSWTTVFGPSTPGAINLIAGQTNGFGATNKNPATMSTSHVTPDGNGGWTLIGDTDPLGDVCSTAADQNTFTGKNIGDTLNAKGISWGWFEGGFDLTLTNANGTTGCARSTPQTVANAASVSTDYIPHHQPFQYYASTANLTHARPSSLAAIGKSVQTDGVTPEPANHQYDSHDFFEALAAGNLPAVAFVKAPAFQDGHPGYSNPIDEQNFIVQVVSAIQLSREWSSTAIVLAYDDSDGWYDHQAPPIVNPSNGVADALNGAGLCNKGLQQAGPAPAMPLLGVDGKPALGRCGYGTRMPLLVVSPYAKHNYVDHTLTDQSSILKFVEDNWLAGQRIQAGGSFDTIAGTIQNMLTL